jgi:hypothetical protein
MNALLRSLPALCALIVALGAIVFWGAATVGVHYHPQSPHAHLVFPYLMGSFVAAALSILGFAFHLTNRRKSWRRALREILTGAGAFVMAGVLLPFIYRVPDEIMVTYQGQTYAIPRVWNPGTNQAGTTLQVEFCLPSFEPKYASLDCSLYGLFELTTTPILRGIHAGMELETVNAAQDGNRILSKGDLVRMADGRLEDAHGWRRSQYRVDGDGKVEDFRICPVGKTYVNAPCDVGVRTALGTVFIHLPRDRSAVTEAAAFLARLEDWRCPEAAGCRAGQ